MTELNLISKIPIIEEFNESDIEDNKENKINSYLNFDNMLEKFNFPSFNNSLKSFFDKEINKNQIEQNIIIKGIIPGLTINKSFISQNKKNEKGEIEKEYYKSQSIKLLSDDGHLIKEKQEAYKNCLNGNEKVSFLRILDGKGHKIIKERNRKTGEKNEKNLFKNLNENELNDFNLKYNFYRNKIQFQKYYDLIKDISFKNRFDIWNKYKYINKDNYYDNHYYKYKNLIDDYIGDNVKF